MSAEAPSPAPSTDRSRSPQECAARLADLQENVESVFQGKSTVVRHTIACLLAGGHLLLEDVPGVGKTTLGLALAKSLGLDFRRIQFTSDLLPSDIVGVSVYRPETGEFDFKPGPLFAGVVLADEINRTTPRTQSALLEAMSEAKISVDNVTHQLPDPFLVVATQNPLEHHGTYPLPESQLDRFLMRLSIGYPARAIEREILLERGRGEPVHELEAAVDVDEFKVLQRRASQVRLDESLVDYLMEVVDQTRRDSRIRIGVSTRGALALARLARAWALLEGRDFCIPDDLRQLFVACFAHRVALAGSASDGDKDQSEMIIESIVSDVDVPT
jgi:MoxR-like ATPase